MNLNIWYKCKGVGCFGDLGYATEVHGFHAHMIRWCSLHTFNLGAMVWAAAGAFDILVTKARDSTCNLTVMCKEA